MDCRKARCFLIASFDGELDPDVRRSLSYHLKDCKKCRHEAFYYRELFSAKESLPELVPSTDFNEKLMASIRLREAQAQWPQAARAPRNTRRWQIVLVPTVFVAAAAAAFMLFSTSTVTNSDSQPEEMASVPAPAVAPMQQPAPAPVTGETPRYIVYSSQRLMHSQPQRIFRGIPTTTALQDHPFAAEIEQLAGSSSRQEPLADYLSRQRTRYVLPVVNNAQPKERIY